MAIVIVIEKWRPYLLGRHFQVLTDQKSLKFLIEPRIMGEEQQKWVSIEEGSIVQGGQNCDSKKNHLEFLGYYMSYMI